MNSKDRAIINSHRIKIIEDLHDDVTIKLYEVKILTLKEYDDIKNLTTQQDRNAKLLDTLQGKCDGFEQLKAATKDWYSWIFNLLNDVNNLADDEYSLAIEGGVPPIPVHNVTRRSLLENVRKELRLLKRGHYLVLRGMIGCGKSCLAAESLNQSLVQECFKGKVFWLSAGSEVSDDVWGLQAELYERIFSDELNRDVKRALAQLKNRFEKAELKDSLLVLDDVASYRVIEALDICCKVLVTTNDVDVMKNRLSVTTFIKVEEVFTEKETLQLLAQCVSIDIDKLPPQAKLIYTQSKGYPMTVSLIGAQLSEHKEEAAEVPKSWDLYVQSLNNRDIGNIKRRSLLGSNGIKPTIDLCISKLDLQLQEYYQDFALFVEDVNIKPEVLQTLWSVSEYRLKNEVMAEFVRKSLVVRKWNQKLNSYVYGIHDLLLEYLRNLLNSEQSRALHEKLVRCYEKNCENGDFSKLPQNDNYIFYYLGYHLKEAELFSLFPNLYLNLEFIEAKLRAVGPADLLSDYRKYREYITDKWAPQNMDKVRDFEWFVEWAGQSIRRLKTVDIVQFALQEHKNSHVFKAALVLARKRQTNKYIKFPLGAPDSRVAPQVIQYSDHITAACFSDVKSNIIVAGESGRIQIIDSKGFVLRTFEGHGKKITHLALSKNEQHFLSTSEDTNIKVWKLVAADSPTNGVVSNGYGNYNRTPSPRQRQTSYSEFWNVDTTGETSVIEFTLHKGIVTCAEFSPDSKKIVSASHDKTIKVWCLLSESLMLSINLRSEPTTCMFSNCGSIVFYSGSDSQVVACDAVSSKLLASFTSPFPVKSMYAINRGGEMELILLTNYSVCSHGIHEAGNIIDYEKVPMFKDYSRKEYEQFLCCAVPQDGSYIAVAVSNHKILLCEPRGQVIREFHEPSGNPIYLAADSRSNCLLGIYQDQIVRLWKVEVKPGELPPTLKSNFHCVWHPTESLPFITVPTNRNSVEILCGRDVRESHFFGKREVISCALTEDLAHVICGCDDGSVWHSTNEKFQLTMTLSSAIYSVCGYKLQNNLIIVAATNHSQLKIWKNDRVKEIDLGSRECINFFFLNSSSQLLTICKDFSIKKWNIGYETLYDQMEIVNHQRLDGEVIDCALNCRNYLAVVDGKRSLLQLHSIIQISHPYSVKLESQPTTCSFSPDGESLAVGFYNGSLQIFSMNAMKFIRYIKIISGPIQSLCMGDEGILGVVCHHTVAIIPATGEKIAQVQLSAKQIEKSPERNEFVTIDTEGNIHMLTLLDNQTENTEIRPLLTLDLNSQ